MTITKKKERLKAGVIKVLLVEDDSADAEWVRRAIAKAGSGTFKLDRVDRLSLALERLVKGGIDAILLDMKLPDGIGLEVFEKIQRAAPTLPIVILTGTVLEERVALQAIEKGAQDYLFKGKIDPAPLVRAIRYAFERKRAEEKILQAMNVKTEFISMVSHELRTPLTAIKEGVELVQDGTVGVLNPDQKKYLDLAKRNIDRLARLINEVLDFQKLESRQAEIHIEENDINGLVNEVREAFALVAKKKGIELVTQLEESPPKIFFDKDKIIQVLTNLVGNALKVMEKGKIILKTKYLENIIRVSVDDQGPGIKEKDFPKLFQVFSQLAAGDERKPGTTGLGLAISKQIIEAHQGKIGVESVYGKGATFYFTIPRRLESLNKKLGEILVEEGLVSEQQIKEALKKQEGSG